jgi:uncharacterized protein with NAD-binding domain and iron-sulfur cluster
VRIENLELHLNVSQINYSGFIGKLTETLSRLTNSSWKIISSSDSGATTVAEEEDMLEKKKLAQIVEHPHVKEVLNTFTDMEILDIKTKKMA